MDYSRGVRSVLRNGMWVSGVKLEFRCEKIYEADSGSSVLMIDEARKRLRGRPATR